MPSSSRACVDGVLCSATATEGRGKHARSADVRSARAMAASSKRHHATTSASASLCAAAGLCGDQRVDGVERTRSSKQQPRRQADVGKRSGASSA